MENQSLNRFKEQLRTLGSILPESWSMLEPIFTELLLPKGSFFSLSGSKKQKVAFVIEGIFRQYHLSEEGEEFNLSFFTKDDFICSGMGHEGVSTTTIQALQDSRIFTTTYEDFTGIVKGRPDLEHIHKNFLFRLVEKQQQRNTVQLKASASERYLWFLEHSGSLLDRIPHYHIASYLGMTPTQLCRVRKNHQHL